MISITREGGIPWLPKLFLKDSPGAALAMFDAVALPEVLQLDVVALPEVLQLLS